MNDARRLALAFADLVSPSALDAKAFRDDVWELARSLDVPFEQAEFQYLIVRLACMIEADETFRRNVVEALGMETGG